MVKVAGRFAEYLMGLFGQETDEVNQSIHSIYNYRYYSSRKVLDFNSKGNSDVVIVASGPSLDKNIVALKEVANSLTVVSAGSAIGALLRNGISLAMLCYLRCPLMFLGTCAYW